jgi:hypothetical protein
MAGSWKMTAGSYAGREGRSNGAGKCWTGYPHHGDEAGATEAARVKYFKRLLEEGPSAGATEYFEVKDDLAVACCIVVGTDGKAKSAAPPGGPLKEEDFSLTEIEADEFNGAAGKAQ